MLEIEEEAVQPFQTYEQAVNWIVGLVSFGIKPGLKRMEMLMDMLDHPDRRLKFIMWPARTARDPPALI